MVITTNPEYCSTQLATVRYYGDQQLSSCWGGKVRAHTHPAVTGVQQLTPFSWSSCILFNKRKKSSVPVIICIIIVIMNNWSCGIQQQSGWGCCWDAVWFDGEVMHCLGWMELVLRCWLASKLNSRISYLRVDSLSSFLFGSFGLFAGLWPLLVALCSA